MQFNILPNGNLSIVADASDAEMLEDISSVRGGDDVSCFCDLLESTGWSPNGRLYLVAPESVGALTEAPILSNDVTFEDNGAVTVHGSVWWFPDYMVINPFDKLRTTGTVVFAAA